MNLNDKAVDDYVEMVDRRDKHCFAEETVIRSPMSDRDLPSIIYAPLSGDKLLDAKMDRIPGVALR
jgi:hypothetical protein